MSDTTSLVISIVSLVGTIAATLIGGYITYYNEERKAHREVNKILLKYRDPLLLSAQDLQARLYGICDLVVMDFYEKDPPGEAIYKDTLFIYTAYVVGQFLSWVWIMRRQAQFVALISNSSPKRLKWWSFAPDHGGSNLTKNLDKIKASFNSDAHGEIERPFILFKAHQVAIGELMSFQDEKTGEYFCMGFATFTHKWKNGDPGKAQVQSSVTSGDTMAGVANTISDREFREQFSSIEKGIDAIWKHRKKNRHAPMERRNGGSDGRLRRLQHLLLDLMISLDPQQLINNEQESKFAIGPSHCACNRPQCFCKCETCNRNHEHFKPGTMVECQCITCQPQNGAHKPHTVVSEAHLDAQAGATRGVNGREISADHQV